MTTETGPIWNVPLIDTLPLGEQVRQQMPSRKDLAMCGSFCGASGSRVALAYEVLLAHYHKVCEERDLLKRILSKVQLTQALEHIELDAKT